MPTISPVLRIGPKIVALPVVHGSGDCALEVRRMMLEHRFECLAVPLPPSFQSNVENAIQRLPEPAVVIQREACEYQPPWMNEDEDEEDDDELSAVSYVPIDPCQPVIAGLRVALGERIARAFIDLETSSFEIQSAILPDAYALKKVRLERFAAAILPSVPPPPVGQPRARINAMAHRLRELESKYDSILFICSLLDWPWIRDAFLNGPAETPEDDEVEPVEAMSVDPRTLLFMMGELPFITGLYEQARGQLDDDTNLSIDGVKALLLTARQRYYAELRSRARKITPQILRTCLKYIRNMSLLQHRLTPDLYTIVVAAKQVCGDSFAVQVAETARDYDVSYLIADAPAQMGIDRLRLPNGEIYHAKSRLPGPPLEWKSCELSRRPETTERERWQMQWNPSGQCSWPPEDKMIENFRSHVMDRAKQILGTDLVRTEKFTTSVQDGIDIRDTLRNWHTGDIYVKVMPPVRGELDAVVMLFDSPADPRDYPWRTTWFAEHNEESTLAFFATDFSREMVGPGIGLASYGGAMFLFPPLVIPDIWQDPRLDFTTTLEERLLAAACLYSRNSQIALLSPLPPGAGWRRLARRFHKKWIHVPLGQFSDSTVQQLRMAHVLNGRQVRSYAAHFIRRS
ncbi:MAG: hypothetical protein KDA92_01185 [Planctomycetales bacterium]|nr:hypothetical protein [Planctomycetales bacterium]MCA9168309.1 hypothetical protein [Planctomycetales bacterium]